jgi:lactate permease
MPGFLATCIALAPMLVALLTLALLRWSGRAAGLATLGLALLLVLFVPGFQLAPLATVVALGRGGGTSLLVLSVLFPGLLLYHLQRVTGSLEVLARGVGGLTGDPARQTLLLVLGLAPFAESVSGYGVGIVVVIPLFVALGIDPRRAALLGVFGQLAVPWGALGAGTIVGAELTGLPPGWLAARTAALCLPLPPAYALLALGVAGGAAALRRAWFAALLGGAALGLGLLGLSLWVGVELAGVLASALALTLLACEARLAGDEHAVARGRPSTGAMPVWRAAAPYVLLTSALLLTRLVPPLREWLQSRAVLELPALGLRLPLLYAPGFWLLLSALAAAPLLGARAGMLRDSLARTWRQFAPGALAILCFVATAQLMSASGMTAQLGAAAATLGAGYVWVAPWLGALGGWLTGSNTGGNAMFAQLQQEAAARAGLPLDWLMGAQNGAGSIATMAAPARTVLAATTAGIAGGESFVLRRAGPTVLLAVLAITLGLVLVA